MSFSVLRRGCSPSGRAVRVTPTTLGDIAVLHVVEERSFGRTAGMARANTSRSSGTVGAIRTLTSPEPAGALAGRPLPLLGLPAPAGPLVEPPATPTRSWVPAAAV